MSRQRSSLRLAACAVLAVVASLALVPVSSAAKPGGSGSTGGGGGTSSSLAVVIVNDKNGNGVPNWGDTVTFSVSTTATTQPEVELACYQDGIKVADGVGGFYAGDPWAPEDQMMTLESYVWTGGEADCTATLFYMKRGKAIDLASIGFKVLA